MKYYSYEARVGSWSMTGTVSEWAREAFSGRITTFKNKDEVLAHLVASAAQKGHTGELEVIRFNEFEREE